MVKSFDDFIQENTFEDIFLNEFAWILAQFFINIVFIVLLFDLIWN